MISRTSNARFLLRSPMANRMMTPHLPTRPYFTFFDTLKDKLQKPFRHVQAFMEPDGMNYQSQLPEGYRLHGNSAASFSASITQNAIELNQWHEMESTVHS